MDRAFQDLGAQSLDPHDDYTKYAEEVASLVARPKAQGACFFAEAESGSMLLPTNLME